MSDSRLGIMSFGDLPVLCTGRYMPGGTGLAEMPKLKRGESGLSSDTPLHVSMGHVPHLCLLFVSCTVIKPLAPWGEGWLLVCGYTAGSWLGHPPAVIILLSCTDTAPSTVGLLVN